MLKRSIVAVLFTALMFMVAYAYFDRNTVITVALILLSVLMLLLLFAALIGWFAYKKVRNGETNWMKTYKKVHGIGLEKEK